MTKIKWSKGPDEWYCIYGKCCICGTEFMCSKARYCPGCGEKIESEVKEGDKEPTTKNDLGVLDKIKAEIKSKIVKRPWLDFEDMERDRNDAFLEALDIINKYRNEVNE